MWTWCAIQGIEGILRITFSMRLSSKDPYPIAVSFQSDRLLGASVSENEDSEIGNLFIWGAPRFTACVLTGLWLSTSILIVPLDEVALYRRLGVYQKDTRGPGLHLILPFPLGESACVSVKQITTLPIGFDVDLKELLDLPLLWTQPHGTEYPMLVGNGTEIVVLNGLLRFKVKEDPVSVRKYLTTSESPTRLVRSLAYQAVQGELNQKSMDQILRTDRVAMEERILQRIEEELSQHDLGIELIDFGLLSVHPPVEVSESYLSVVEASIDAKGKVSQEIIDAERELLRCHKVSSDTIAEAKASQEKQLADVKQNIDKYQTWRDLHEYAPLIAKKQMYFESLIESVDRKPLVLLDSDLPSNTKVWVEEAN